MTKQYELMVLLPASLTQDSINGFTKTLKGLVEAKGGAMVDDQLMGRRPMAYEIKKQREANYMLYHFTLDTSAIQQLEKDVRLNDSVIRSLVTIDEGVKAA